MDRLLLSLNTTYLMKKQKIILTLILMAFLWPLQTTFAQTVKGNEVPNGGLPNDAPDFCDDFQGGAVGNWGQINASLSIQQPGPSGLASDNFLRVFDNINPSFVTNTIDYDGDWTQEGSCFCLDAIELSTQDPSASTNIKLQVFSGSLMAEFDFNQNTSVSLGWITLCAPIETCSGTNLPSNNLGQWTIMSGPNNCNTFNTIITNVTEVRIFVENQTIPGEVNGLDNICIGDCNDFAATCCARNPNLIFNGNFESGNIGFTSDYDFTADLSANSVAPGLYSIGTGAQALAVSPQWILEDPSSCVGLDNENVMLVNGRTQQPGSGFPWNQQGTEIWRQSIPISGPGTYQFCGKFKNLPQPAFDIKPEVSFLVTNGPTLDFGPFVIDVGSGACEWEEVTFTFEVTSNVISAIPIQIFIDHLGNGDGNDLAIDDLALHKLEEVDFGITVAGSTNGPGIEGSFGAAGAGDDGTFDSSCDYLWRITQQPSGSFIGAGNNNSSSTGVPWGLTTTFPTLTFVPETTYRVELILTDCDCLADATRWVEVTIGPNGNVEIINSSFSVSSTAKQNGQAGQPQPSHAPTFYPNPTNGILKADIGHQKTDLQLVDLQGRVLRKWTLSESAELDLSTYPTGIYYLQYKSETDSGSTKVVLQ